MINLPVWIQFIIELVFGTGIFISVALFIPLVIKLWKARNTTGGSASTFAGFNVIQLFTIPHGYFHEGLSAYVGKCPEVYYLGKHYPFYPFFKAPKKQQNIYEY